MKRFVLGALAALALTAITQPAFAQECPPFVDHSHHPVIVHATEILDGAPDPASAAAAADFAASHQTFPADRIAQAVHDDCLDGFVAFEGAMPSGFTRANLPATAALFDMFENAAEPVAGEAKQRWGRTRPYVLDPSVIRCPTIDRSHLGEQKSYPSGHSTRGWGWALLLAEIDPGRAEAVLRRGREYGDSRVVCGFHFPSDVQAGRMVAASVVARLHANRAFRNQLGRARRELARKLS